MELRITLVSCVTAFLLSSCASVAPVSSAPPASPPPQARYLHFMGPWKNGAVEMQVDFSTEGQCRGYKESLLKNPALADKQSLIQTLFRCDAQPTQLPLPVHAVFLLDTGAEVPADFESMRACEYVAKNIAHQVQQACAAR